MVDCAFTKGAHEVYNCAPTQTNDYSEGSQKSTSVSFSLGDDDPQDEFIIDLYYDNKYGGVIFNTVGGRSKCPHEKGTAAVEVPKMEVVSYPPSKVSAHNDLLFYVELSNVGMGQSVMNLYTDPQSNMHGLVTTVDGVNLDTGYAMTTFGSFNNLDPKKVRKLIRVQRGPNIFSAQNIWLTFDSACDDGAGDLLYSLNQYAYVSVPLYNSIDSETGQQILQWIDDCPNIEWADSIKYNNGFLVNSQSETNTLLPITIFNPGHESFDLASHSRLQVSSSRASLLYRLIGTQQWNIGQMYVNGTTSDSNFLALSEDAYGFISLNWAIGYSFIQDGAYEIRR